MELITRLIYTSHHSTIIPHYHKNHYSSHTVYMNLWKVLHQSNQRQNTEWDDTPNDILRTKNMKYTRSTHRIMVPENLVKKEKI